jgi:putative tryptophan/tyrosine transport system substrate-binding protein
MHSMKRRSLILLGSVALGLLLAARAQGQSLPVIGFVNSGPASGIVQPLAAFHRGLNEGGHFEGKNVAIEYRWADNQYDRLAGMMSELVDRRVALIAATGGTAAALAAKASTKTIPILFVSGFDPIQLRLVDGLSKPGGNATGISLYTTELVAKRLELVREIVPTAKVIAVLVNPHTSVAEIESKELEAATSKSGLRLLVLKASVDDELEAAFALASQQGASVIVLSADPFFTSRRNVLVALAKRHGLPAAYPWRVYCEAGGLACYGPSITWAYSRIGSYASNILRGAKPGDLPVQLPTQFEFVINAATAKALGLALSRVTYARADHVIE